MQLSIRIKIGRDTCVTGEWGSSRKRNEIVVMAYYKGPENERTVIYE
jgi:hypothetical protein